MANNFKVRIAFLGLFLMGIAQSSFADMDEKKKTTSHTDIMTNVTEMMRDIGDHMVVISGDLGYGTLTIEQQKAMAKHIRTMALMMVELAQVVDKNNNEKQMRHMATMRNQMDHMMKEVSVGTMKPW